MSWIKVRTNLHEDPRVTRPFSDAQWSTILDVGDRVDAELEAGDVRLTMGGEPTFVSIDDMDGEDNDDHMVGDLGDDTMVGGDGNDLMLGNLGDDSVDGDDGDDQRIFKQQIPANDPGPELTQGGIGVRVCAASYRCHRREFGITKCRETAGNARDDK